MAIFTDRQAIDNNYLQAMFVALFTLLIIWAVAIVVSELLRKGRNTSNTSNTPAAPPVDGHSAGRMNSRYKKATNAVRDALLMLTVATLATLAGYGATKVRDKFL
ncbi:10484_t:CDS:2 [Diversispora eburnea]|uniref:10484_t:CDS:1 n=1 Tax=Diversispora eburnea TaxID=1213867 RepID=A0A9N8VP15_9GLOM|nr:10484_t:CDS:2 [Diversispora eburnea]